ncbi:MAG TPA: NAD(P)/FAD-dependent oxidoreductase [Steroidobacteraceae bacterium]|nr:NAD(P)/FAD-dependent oxidoreductase [Steroidobacteraceae bacterium]
MRPAAFNIAGAGLAGSLLALLLARRGQRVHLIERRPDPRAAAGEDGRSINLALAARGIGALERAGLMGKVAPLLIPMRGRMVHEPPAASRLLPYGQHPAEVIHSIGRAALNRLLIEEAARHPNVTLEFDAACRLDTAAGRLRVQRADGERALPPAAVIACDGAGSTLRAALAAAGHVGVREEPLEHGYRELRIPPRAGDFALEPHALHIWPRHGFMLIALPNPDRSFTATLFLPRTGAVSFQALATDAAVQRFFAEEFPGAAELIPDLLPQWRARPLGHLGTVHARPWHHRGVLLLGDAAHAIVPFHGQGMNAAFEDCMLLDDLLAEEPLSWDEVCARFEARRRPDAEAIAQMALENYAEMRSRVLDGKFLWQKELALELERRFPHRFIPRYAMVMFHPEIPYAEALRRGAVQQRILDELHARRLPSGQADYALAQQLVEERL